MLSRTRTSSGGRRVLSMGASSSMLRRIVHAISIRIAVIRVRGSCRSASIAPASMGASLSRAPDRYFMLESQLLGFGDAASTEVV